MDDLQSRVCLSRRRERVKMETMMTMQTKRTMKKTTTKKMMMTKRR
jgi:hypothetical protein